MSHVIREMRWGGFNHEKKISNDIDTFNRIFNNAKRL